MRLIISTADTIVFLLNRPSFLNPGPCRLRATGQAFLGVPREKEGHGCVRSQLHVQLGSKAAFHYRPLVAPFLLQTVTLAQQTLLTLPHCIWIARHITKSSLSLEKSPNQLKYPRKLAAGVQRDSTLWYIAKTIGFVGLTKQGGYILWILISLPNT